MKVKDIINSQTKFANFTTKFIVKPQGTANQYHNSECNYLSNEVAEMEVNTWFVCGTKKNYCEFVIIVERNKEYEAKREKAWKDLISK